jgi:DNA-binding CsgD family transcriptional regulator
VLFNQMRSLDIGAQTSQDTPSFLERRESSPVTQNADGWLRRLLNEVGFGVLILDVNLEVYFCNEIARNAFVEIGLQQILHFKGSESRASNCLSTLPSKPFYDHAKRALQGERKLVILGEGGRQVMVALSLINLGGEHLKRGLLVTTERKSVCKDGSLWAYGKALGLTSGELRVLGLLGTGQDPKVVAKNLQVSVTTVRSHIRSIIGKTDSSNLRDVLFKLSKLPPMPEICFA